MSAFSLVTAHIKMCLSALISRVPYTNLSYGMSARDMYRVISCVTTYNK